MLRRTPSVILKSKPSYPHMVGELDHHLRDPVPGQHLYLPLSALTAGRLSAATEYLLIQVARDRGFKSQFWLTANQLVRRFDGEVLPSEVRNGVDVGLGRGPLLLYNLDDIEPSDAALFLRSFPMPAAVGSVFDPEHAFSSDGGGRGDHGIYSSKSSDSVTHAWNNNGIAHGTHRIFDGLRWQRHRSPELNAALDEILGAQYGLAATANWIYKDVVEFRRMAVRSGVSAKHAMEGWTSAMQQNAAAAAHISDAMARRKGGAGAGDYGGGRHSGAAGSSSAAAHDPWTFDVDGVGEAGRAVATSQYSASIATALGCADPTSAATGASSSSTATQPPGRWNNVSYSQMPWPMLDLWGTATRSNGVNGNGSNHNKSAANNNGEAAAGAATTTVFASGPLCCVMYNAEQTDRQLEIEAAWRGHVPYDDISLVSSMRVPAGGEEGARYLAAMTAAAAAGGGGGVGTGAEALGSFFRAGGSNRRFIASAATDSAASRTPQRIDAASFEADAAQAEGSDRFWATSAAADDGDASAAMSPPANAASSGGNNSVNAPLPSAAVADAMMRSLPPLPVDVRRQVLGGAAPAPFGVGHLDGGAQVDMFGAAYDHHQQQQDAVGWPAAHSSAVFAAAPPTRPRLNEADFQWSGSLE